MTACERRFDPAILEKERAEHLRMLSLPSHAPVEPSSWELNRRYYYLVRFFQHTGVPRCDHYLPEKKCATTDFAIRDRWFSRTPAGFQESEIPGPVEKILRVGPREDSKEVRAEVYFPLVPAAQESLLASFLEAWHAWYTTCPRRSLAFTAAETRSLFCRNSDPQNCPQQAAIRRLPAGKWQGLPGSAEEMKKVLTELTCHP